MSTERPETEINPRSDAAAPFIPYWRNSPGDPEIRDYSYAAARLEIDGDELRLAVPPVPWKFLIGFACLFLPTFGFLAWYFIPDLPLRLFFAIVGPMVGGLTFGFIFWMLRSHESLGDFLVINRATRTVNLPRSKTQVPFDQILGFQLIRGRRKNDPERDTDLNLLVADAGEVIRYHVMGNPGRRLVNQVLDFSGFNLEEINLGRRGYRDADKSDTGI